MTSRAAKIRRAPALCGDAYHAINSCGECQRIWHRNSARAKVQVAPVKKRPMPTKSVGPPCPECGDTESRSLQRGWSEPDDHFLRRRECKNCGVRFVTAEVVVPTEATTFYRLDYRGREWRRENWRAKYAKSGRRLPVQRSDQLIVTMKVKVNPELERNICLRGHAFTPENTYVYPSGNRCCRLCRKARQRGYYHERKAEAAA